ncbi:MAG TPA: TetR/AcrR family transcriptional regulator [Longimicrobiales bacterium]|nr:TetR/AcrR family transcriptional regulator [Longimicrobiales bacterium]
MSPRDPDTNRRMREEARRRIVAGSLEVFAERGFPGASMREIAERAGVSKGLAYHYFESKEELLVTALRSRLDALLEVTERIRAHDDPRDRLVALVDGLIEHVRERPALFRLTLALAMDARGPELGEAGASLREPMETYLDRVRGLFEELGSADPEVDAVLFRSALLGLCLRIAAEKEELPLDALKGRLVEIFAGGAP